MSFGHIFGVAVQFLPSCIYFWSAFFPRYCAASSSDRIALFTFYVMRRNSAKHHIFWLPHPGSCSAECFVQCTSPKFYHHTFTRSEVIVLTNTPANQQTDTAENIQHSYAMLRRCVIISCFTITQGNSMKPIHEPFAVQQFQETVVGRLKRISGLHAALVCQPRSSASVLLIILP